MKRIYLVRHGESMANVARIHGGAHHSLSERGREQAQFIAERCAKLPLQALLASDFIRARETASIITKHTGLPAQIIPDLGEVLMPSHMMERRYDTPEAIAEEEALIEGLGGPREHDAEGFDEMIGRASRMLGHFSAMSEQHVGVVTHGLFLRCIVGYALFGQNITPRELLALWRGLKSENTGLTILEYRPDSPKKLWRLFVWNDHAHLG